MYKVLIIEDETAYQKILKDSFEKENFEVKLADDCKQALAEVAKRLPDVILLDIMLPGGKNGFDFLEQAKSNETLKDIPVLVITNLSSEEKVSKEIGADSYFVKSETTIEEIVNRVKGLLSGISVEADKEGVIL